jgi:hypothetical protein
VAPAADGHVADRCGIHRCAGIVAHSLVPGQAGRRITGCVRYGTSDGSADGFLMPATVHADTSDKRTRSESCSTMVPAT